MQPNHWVLGKSLTIDAADFTIAASLRALRLADSKRTRCANKVIVSKQLDFGVINKGFHLASSETVTCLGSSKAGRNPFKIET